MKRRAYAIVALAVLGNVAIHAATVAYAIGQERGPGSPVEKAFSLFTDEMPVPCTVWTCTLNFPAVFASMGTLGSIADRSSWAALVAPQIAFVCVASLQTAALALSLARLVDAARARRRRFRTERTPPA